ncbi:hypothetical protein OP10G_1108 [Fimbriimonas ginsengisoli Gsoil 348]|uniref:Uncharacterized protein n=1 Tax=Fimbriimonas ginsengisoli Gsoil 348 TaxID=661478 RepID=A0A068NLX5_FIMGI|nr:hypothetical protein OP10G_1108 [Fimbriimonas ginsengisoli Gsoil 348]
MDRATFFLGASTINQVANLVCERSVPLLRLVRRDLQGKREETFRVVA